jgi:hypothetical protein
VRTSLESWQVGQLGAFWMLQEDMFAPDGSFVPGLPCHLPFFLSLGPRHGDARHVFIAD